MTEHDDLDAELLSRLAEAGGPPVGNDASEPADTGGALRVSLYAPMVVAGPETRQNPIRFKNLLSEAREKLEAVGAASADVDALLAPAEGYLENRDFWQHQQTGLAVFLGPEETHALRLPLEFEELCLVGERFHLKPTFPLLTGDGRFHVLALSQNAVRLLEATRTGVRELALDADVVPGSLADALGHEVTERQLQSHSPTADTGIFHGQGAGTDDVKPEIRKFLGMVDSALAPAFRRDGREPPLVLAAVEELAAMYREVSDHKAIVDQPVAGNPEQRSAEELHEAAWPLVEPVFDRDRHESIERYGNNKADGTCSTDPAEVVIAAMDGRVDTLFVARGVRVWGRVDEVERRVERADDEGPGIEDLIDRAAVGAFRTGAQVFSVDPDEVPDGGALAAIYRF